jgi:hypothetical protein
MGFYKIAIPVGGDGCDCGEAAVGQVEAWAEGPGKMNQSSQSLEMGTARNAPLATGKMLSPS